MFDRVYAVFAVVRRLDKNGVENHGMHLQGIHRTLKGAKKSASHMVMHQQSVKAKWKERSSVYYEPHRITGWETQYFDTAICAYRIEEMEVIE